jgi:MFS family permease
MTVIGRKFTIILAGLIWVLGSILQGTAYSVAQLVVGRVIAGFASASARVEPALQSLFADPSFDRAVGMSSVCISEPRSLDG